jgi:NAD(P)H dehydrogenase (quinone)
MPATPSPWELSMTIVVTGATGHLGRLTVEALLHRGTPADQIVATGRQVDKLDELAARGVTVKRADYTDPSSLADAFTGAEKVLLVSSSEVGQRAVQHANAIQAAKEAGVGLIAYTSIPKADTSSLLLAAEHKQTEQLLADSGVPHVLLRNGWYVENYTGQLPVYLEHGIAGAAGEGKVSPATRADFAEAAATVLVEDGHAGKTYEPGGQAVAMTDLAQVVSEAAGKPVEYHDMPVEQYTQVLVGAGLPEPVAAVFADGDRGIRDGELQVDPADLERLLGRPATPLAEAVRADVAALRG